MYEIKSDIPIPMSNSHKYSWNDMKIGDCFDVPFVGENPYRNIYSSFNYFKKRYNQNYKIKIRTFPGTKEGIVRVWRIE